MTSVYKWKFQDITKKGAVSLGVLDVDHYVCTVDHKNYSVPHHYTQVRYGSRLVDETSRLHSLTLRRRCAWICAATEADCLAKSARFNRIDARDAASSDGCSTWLSFLRLR